MARAKANRSRSTLDLLKSRLDRSSYKTSIPSKRPRYLHASLSRSATGQRTPIAETINEAAGDQRLEEGETEEEEEGEEYEEDSAHFAEADSVFEVEPNPEVKWRYMLRQDLRQDNGDNRKPQLPRTDGEFAHRYNVLLIGIWKWASKYFAPHDVDHVKEADLRDEHMLHSYIDSIAMATSPDIRWNDVIQTLLPRLVMGIIMKVIQIHIFGLELFGASQAQLRILRLADKFRTERDHESELPNIFKRQEVRASIINGFYPSELEIPNTLEPNILKVMTGIVSLLGPLSIHSTARTSRYAHSLAYLLIDAARLHFDMRREPDTIYFVYGLTPGCRIDDHTQFEVPVLPTSTKPERGDLEPRIHIVIAPGIMALRKFRHGHKSQYQTRTIAEAMAMTEWMGPDHSRKSPKQTSRYLDHLGKRKRRKQ